MKNIVLFDTSVGTLNHGDEIIMESFLKNGKELLEGNYVASFPTHTPCFSFYQQLKINPRYSFVRNADHKFICGTNIINNKMFFPFPFWNINLFNSACYKDSVTVGVGCTNFKSGSDKVSFYSRLLFSKILSKKYKHSVRDERTKRIIESICGEGSAINTGCPTIWGLTKEHCAAIPTAKADRVVFTLTDYSVDRKADQSLIDTLKKLYTDIYYWPQGTQDAKYFATLENTDGITVLTPSVKAYSELLSQGNIDYIGTRLHAGIYAMQHKIRSVILIVDNRAQDMAQTYNINTLARDCEDIEGYLTNEIVTSVKIDEDAIKLWKSQFTEGEK